MDDGSKGNILVPVYVKGAGTDRATVTVKFNASGVLESSTDAYEDTIWDKDADFKNYLTIDSAKGSFYNKGLGKLKFECNGFIDALADKNPITVDGVPVDSDDVIVERGSTKVTLKNEYLKTLALGNHTMKISYADGQSITATIRIVNTPITGDNGFGLLPIFMVLALAGMVAVFFVIKKKSKA